MYQCRRSRTSFPPTGEGWYSYSKLWCNAMWALQAAQCWLQYIWLWVHMYTNTFAFETPSYSFCFLNTSAQIIKHFKTVTTKLYKLHNSLFMSPPLPPFFFSFDVPFVLTNGNKLNLILSSNLQNWRYVEDVWAQLMGSACFPIWDWSTFCCFPAER